MVDGVEHRGAEGAFLEGVDEDYVRALGLAVVAGRSLSSADVVGARPVAVVNEAFVRAYLDGSFTTGRTVALRGDSPPLEIVGVVEDVRNAGLREPPAAQLLMPHTVSGTSVGLIVRTSGDPNALQARMLDAVWAVDPGVALRDVQTLDEVLRVAYLTAPTFAAGLLGVFAAIALILATVGVFSVTAYAVSLETHDIGVRMALGAEPRSVVRMIVSRGIRPVVIGAALGVAASYWLARLLESQIFGVSATDPATFATVIAALLVAGTIACFLPARRATRIDPLIALRDA